MPDAKTRKLLHALEQNWQAEIRGACTYRALAQREDDPVRQKTLEHLAQAEEKHAALWARRIQDLGGAEPVYRGSPSGDADSIVNRLGGVDMALRRLEIDESRDIARYGQQLKELGDGPSVSILERVIEDEREHYQELSTLIRNRYPRSAIQTPDAKAQLEELLAKRGGQGRKAAGWIGDAIYGVNDGLGAIFGIVSGVSGATLGNSHYVLLAGIAGMIASALSMGSGAYLAAKSEREIYEAEVEREREAIRMNGPEARELLSLYYQVKGIPSEDADHIVEHLARDEAQFLRALAAERLNATEEALPQPFVSAFSGAASTAVGAFIPIVPFFFLTGYPAVFLSAAVSLAAHFAVGAAKSLITVRSWWSSGLEMTLVGAVEGIVTYVIGIGLGHVGA
ncbi:VIT1/CCC1 transporter family protein [Pseudacidobacterium ailaaui]|uniref:VIT1/CCC1 transporter family protein n=1 Tax=Pseudacidobacterium ailaaui TaxID=1382359 RepID=UPI000479C445|nr:VIT1/CCC1 transporter family protein [Pseudacidobacterium ailaaui]MBX6360308.1 VIT1/CCC1 transporter family protein [Pseudacidobacterium ailaaui]